MDRLSADYPNHPVRPDPDRLPRQRAHVEAANGFHAQVAIVVNGRHHQANFVHVGRAQHPQPGAPSTLAGRQQVAHRIRLDRIGMPFDGQLHQLADRAFVARHGDGLCQRAQPFKVGCPDACGWKASLCHTLIPGDA